LVNNEPQGNFGAPVPIGFVWLSSA
jgi:hypothetical protein